jgi:hypothetical protein
MKLLVNTLLHKISFKAGEATRSSVRGRLPTATHVVRLPLRPADTIDGRLLARNKPILLRIGCLPSPSVSSIISSRGTSWGSGFRVVWGSSGSLDSPHDCVVVSEKLAMTICQRARAPVDIQCCSPGLEGLVGLACTTDVVVHVLPLPVRLGEVGGVSEYDIPKFLHPHVLPLRQ